MAIILAKCYPSCNYSNCSIYIIIIYNNSKYGVIMNANCGSLRPAADSSVAGRRCGEMSMFDRSPCANYGGRSTSAILNPFTGASKCSSMDIKGDWRCDKNPARWRDGTRGTPPTDNTIIIFSERLQDTRDVDVHSHTSYEIDMNDI